MGFGDLLVVTDTASPVKLNAKTYHFTDAFTLSNMAYSQCMRVIPTTTGYGFTKDTALRRNSDNNAWIVDGMTVHKHYNGTNEQGGHFHEILWANMGQQHDINLMAANLNDYYHVEANGGASTDQIDQTGPSYVKFGTGSTINGLARFLRSGVSPAFVEKSKWQIGMAVSLSTNMIFRLGVAGEQVDVSNNSLRKYGIEGCSSAPEGQVILVYSANGTTRSIQASTEPIAQSAASFICQHTPSVNIKMIKGLAQTVVTKSSHVPSSGGIQFISGDDSGILKGGIKTTVGSEQKFLRIYGQRFVSFVSTDKWSHNLWL